MQKSVQAAAIFWPRVSQNSRSYFPIIKLSLFSHPVFVMPSKSKQIIFGREQASGLFFKKTTQLDGCLLLCRRKKKKYCNSNLHKKKLSTTTYRKKRKISPPQKEILSWSNTLHSVYTWIILAGKNQTHYLFQSQKLFLTLMPFCPRNFFV